MSRWLAAWRVALRSLVRRDREEQELQEEFQYHLQRQIEEGLQAGLTPDEARFAALRAMGAIERSKEECRDMRTGNLIADFIGDLRYAGRSLRKNPEFAALAILVMALGIGANTAVFSVVNAVLLKPLPYPGADRIVTVATWDAARRTVNPLVAIANYRDWRDQASLFDAMASYRGGEIPVTPGNTAEYARTATVDLQFFSVFGVDAAIGRTFVPQEMAPGSTVALISHAYWQSRFGGDPAILQRTIRVNTGQRSIVGVMPPGFHFPNNTDIWTPQTTQSTSRTSHNLFAVGRLKPNVTLAQAQSELTGIAARLEQQYPESNKDRSVVATPLQDALVSRVRLTLYLLWSVVAIVLLIACANTATLLLAEATARHREVAVRAALGASRRRIVRQLITESLLLALASAAAGIALAYWGGRALVALTPADVVRLAHSGIDGGVLLFTLAVSLATTVLFGLVPALHASRIDLVDALQQKSVRTGTGGRGIQMREVLVISEIALAVTLLTGAGLLVKSLVALHGVELGYQPENVLVMRATGVRSLPENNAFFREIRSRIAALPGVVAVGATSIPPGDLNNAGDGAYSIDWKPELRDRSRETQALFTIVAPGTFSALGVPLKQGRDFNEGDAADRPMVAIVNESLVRKSFGGDNPIGRTIFCTFDSQAGMTIVGVVGDMRQRNPGAEPMPDCIMPYSQHSYNGRTLNMLVRTAGDPTAFVAPLRRIAADVSPEVPVAFTTLDATVAKTVEDPRFRAMLVGVFAALAVGLAMAGVYGVMAYGVQQRSREIGVRIALGASSGSVLRLMLERGARLAGIGLLIGLAGAAAATRVLKTMLFEVQPIDAQVYFAVSMLLGLVTLAAAYLPARRAAGLDPTEILRLE
jgi:predicted permease